MSQNWLLRMMKWHNKYQQLMKGRYSRFDTLNKVLVISAFILGLLAPFVPYQIARILSLLLWGSVFYRLFSKRIYLRSNENQKYLQLVQKIRSIFQKDQKTAAKNYRIVKCQNCQQKLRVPKGRGKIKITCKSCGAQMIKKV